MSILLDKFSILSDTYIGGKKIMNYTKAIRNSSTITKVAFLKLLMNIVDTFKLFQLKH